MDNNRQPRSLRSRLLLTTLLCWLLPILIVVTLAGYLLSSSYERSARQQLEDSAQHALEQVALRLETLFDLSRRVSYDGIIRSAYRSWQQDGDGAALYRRVDEYLSQNFTREDAIPVTYICFWDLPDVHPYASRRGDFGYSTLRHYREQIEPDLIERMHGVDTEILLLEYDGELYMARNLLDARFHPYATVVFVCNQELLFQSLESVRLIADVSLTLDEALLLDVDGRLKTVSPEADVPASSDFSVTLDGHSLRLGASVAPFDFWMDIPLMRIAAGLVAALVLPLLLAMLWRFRRLVTRPVEILMEADTQLQDGERGYQIEEKANSREFQELYDHFNLMSAEMKNQFERSYLEQQALQQARIKALQSQINPHFLNNTLEIINWEARIAGNDRVSAMIEALSTMLNASMGRDGRDKIHLREELGYVDAYLYIIRERLGERLEIRREVDESILDVMVPRLILQPIVENAVEHDITARRGGKLSIRAHRENDRMVLEVEHDGTMSDEDLETIRATLASAAADTDTRGQLGLRNVNQRLHLLYGSDGELSVGQNGADTILARVSFPIET